jgi:hypothetical protein
VTKTNWRSGAASAIQSATSTLLGIEVMENGSFILCIEEIIYVQVFVLAVMKETMCFLQYLAQSKEFEADVLSLLI